MPRTKGTVADFAYNDDWYGLEGGPRESSDGDVTGPAPFAPGKAVNMLLPWSVDGEWPAIAAADDLSQLRRGGGLGETL